MGGTRNEFSGSAVNAVQAGNISGGVHFVSERSLPVPRQLPGDVAHFHDREAYLLGLNEWLDTEHESACPTRIIVGVGGVGKTSLVTHWAHLMRNRFPDGDLYVDLRGYHADEALEATDALEALLRAFDISGERIPAGRDARGTLLRTLLHGRQILMVLDNAATVSQVRPLLPGSSSCRVLITSRTRLTGLVTREGASTMALDVLSPDRAVGLLSQVAGTERVDADPDSAAEVAKACGHLPLALRIAAGRLVAHPDLTMAELAADLAAERLNAFSDDGDEFSEVRTVFSWSYRDLSPESARLFRLLGLPAGPDISLEGAAALAGLPVPGARRLLDGLVNAHLVKEDPPRRYRLHDLVKLFAAERAAESADGQAALRRLHLWYCHALDHATQVFSPDFSRIAVDLPPTGSPVPEHADRAAALRWCEVEHDNLISAVGQADEELAWKLPVLLLGVFLTRRPLNDWVDTHEIGIAAAKARGERLAEAWLCTSVALAHRDLREFPKALSRLEQGLEGWKAVGVEWGTAWVLRDIGGVKHLMGDLAGAESTLRAALDLHVESGDRFGEATALRLLGGVLADLGACGAAVEALEGALRIRREQGNVGGEALVLAQLSEVSIIDDRLDEAVAHAQAALSIPLITQYTSSEARAHDAIATALDLLGRTDEASAHWHTAVNRYAAMFDPRADEIRALLNGGRSRPGPLTCGEAGGQPQGEGRGRRGKQEQGDRKGGGVA